MKYSIADINIDIDYKGNRLLRILKDYKSDYLNADFSITITQEDVKYEESLSEELCSVGYYKMNACLRKVGEAIHNYNAFVLHSACFDVDGVGVAFTARSGTGKTTHMCYWKMLLGDKMTFVNGDKPIVRFFEDEPNVPYAYGTPWNGKERFGCNMRTPLKHICFIERSERNFVDKVDKQAAINLIFNQVYMPKDSVAVANTMQLIDRLLSCCSIWKIHCNMDIQAAEIAYNAIFNAK